MAARSRTFDYWKFVRLVNDFISIDSAGWLLMMNPRKLQRTLIGAAAMLLLGYSESTAHPNDRSKRGGKGIVLLRCQTLCTPAR